MGLISETPVTTYHHSSGAPVKKRMQYLCRVQTPPAEALHEKWSLENGDVWGFVFNYMANELHFYNLKNGETYGPSSVKATLTSTDWAVLTLVSSRDLRATVVSEKAVHQETTVDPLWNHSALVRAMSMKPASKSKETQTVVEIKEEFSSQPLHEEEEEENIHPQPPLKRILTSTVWETKSGPSGRWYYRSSRLVTRGKDPSDDFVLEYFNSTCGVFQTSLRVPLAAWLKMIDEKSTKLKELFKQSQTAIDIIMVKKTLTFADDSSSSSSSSSST